MSISAGRLIHAITVLNFTTTRDLYGQPIEEWRDGATIRADVRGVSSRELMSAGAETAQATVRVYVRGESGRTINATSRLKILSGPYKGVTLNVIGPPVPDEKGQRLEILCKQGTEK